MACNFSSQLRQLMPQSGPIPRDGNTPSSAESQMKYKNPQETKHRNYRNGWKKVIARRNHHRWWKPLPPNHSKAAPFFATLNFMALANNAWKESESICRGARGDGDVHAGITGAEHRSKRVWHGARDACGRPGQDGTKRNNEEATGLNRAQ